jgi:hypothetical protein
MHHSSAAAQRQKKSLGCLRSFCLLYSVNSENLTQKKPYTAQILSYKIFSFCEQTLKISANDASGQGLQYAV